MMREKTIFVVGLTGSDQAAIAAAIARRLTERRGVMWGHEAFDDIVERYSGHVRTLIEKGQKFLPTADRITLRALDGRRASQDPTVFSMHSRCVVNAEVFACILAKGTVIVVTMPSEYSLAVLCAYKDQPADDSARVRYYETLLEGRKDILRVDRLRANMSKRPLDEIAEQAALWFGALHPKRRSLVNA